MANQYYRPTRKVILCAEELGTYSSTVSAFDILYQNETLSAGSIMVPGPWFTQAIGLQQQHPKSELGLCLTLTSEFENYRWGPIHPNSQNTGLVDKTGVYFHQTVDKVAEHASAEAVKDELAAQIDFAKAQGLKINHLTCHLDCASHPKFLPTTIALALEYQITLVISKAMLASLDSEAQQLWTARLTAAQNPIFDSIIKLDVELEGEEISRQISEQLGALAPGFHFAHCHPVDSIYELDLSEDQARKRLCQCRALLYTDPMLIGACHQMNVTTFAWHPYVELYDD